MSRVMKNSGIEWIGTIPDDWQLERLQWHIEEIIKKNDPVVTDSILSLTKDKGVIPYEDKGNQGNKAKDDLTGYKLAYKNTIIVNSMNVLIGSVDISDYEGCVSPVYYVFKNKENTSIRFINYIFKTEAFQKQLRRYANGIMEIRLRVSAENILKQNIAIPNFSSQEKIVSLLDERCAEIDNIISKTRASIEEYKKYKQAVITEAITGHCLYNGRYRRASVLFETDIPISWDICKLKYLSEEIGDGLHSTPEYDETGDVFFINGNNIGQENLVIKESTNRLNDIELNKYKAPKLSSNTIMISLNGATYGKTSFYNMEKVLLGKSAGYITLKKNINKKYVRYYLQSSIAQKLMTYSLNGTTIQNLSLGTLNEFPITIPDDNIQESIIRYLDDKCSEIDKLIEKKEAFISEMESYKKSLIYEYVTGKKTVI